MGSSGQGLRDLGYKKWAWQSCNFVQKTCVSYDCTTMEKVLNNREEDHGDGFRLQLGLRLMGKVQDLGLSIGHDKGYNKNCGTVSSQRPCKGRND